MNHIRNQHGKTTALYETHGTRTVLRSTNGSLKGSYDSRDNITRRANGVHYSYGNSLAQLA